MPVTALLPWDIIGMRYIDEPLWFPRPPSRPGPFLAQMADSMSCLRSTFLRWRVAWLQVLDSVGKHQVLIFVHSRKETAKTARYLKEEALKDDKLAQFMQVCQLSFNIT